MTISLFGLTLLYLFLHAWLIHPNCHPPWLYLFLHSLLPNLFFHSSTLSIQAGTISFQLLERQEREDAIERKEKKPSWACNVNAMVAIWHHEIQGIDWFLSHAFISSFLHSQLCHFSVGKHFCQPCTACNQHSVCVLTHSLTHSLTQFPTQPKCLSTLSR